MTDTDRMPFGKFKGKMMQDVPATYLDWLIGQDFVNNWPDVKAYIEANLSDIHKEIED